MAEASVSWFISLAFVSVLVPSAVYYRSAPVSIGKRGRWTVNAARRRLGAEFTRGGGDLLINVSERKLWCCMALGSPRLRVKRAGSVAGSGTDDDVSPSPSNRVPRFEGGGKGMPTQVRGHVPVLLLPEMHPRSLGSPWLGGVPSPSG